MATFKPSFILKNLEHFPESLLSTAEKTFIRSLGDTHQSLNDFINACHQSNCFNGESKGNILFLTFVLDHVMKHFTPQIAQDNSLAWFVTALLSRLGRENIENDHFKSLTKLRGIICAANRDDGRIFAIALAYAECHYRVCEHSSIHALNHQKRDTFSRLAITGQQVDAWIAAASEDNRDKIKRQDDSLDFLNPPHSALIMAWINNTEFTRLLEPTKSIRNSVITTRDSIIVGMRNSLFAYNPVPSTTNPWDSNLGANFANDVL